MRWTLREHGLVLFGPDPKTLIDPVEPDGLRREAKDVIHKWRLEIDAQPEMLENRWLQTYAVISHCRLLYTVQHGRVASKPSAARWALGALEPRWAGLFEPAWADRPDPKLKSKLKADPDQTRATLECVDYVLEMGSIRET